MRWTSVVAIYILFWTLSVFLVLPWGIRTHVEAGTDRIAGQADSAPHDFPVGKVAGRVTILATTLFALFFLNYNYGWLTLDMLDFTGAMKPPVAEVSR